MGSERLRRLPYPPLLLRVFRTSVVVWLLARVTYVVVLMVGVLFFGILPVEDGISAAFHPASLSRVTMVALTAVLVWLHRHRAHEHLLQANFGVSSAWFWAASLFAAGILDAAAQALLSGL
jgi:fumarate reductase subunit D